VSQLELSEFFLKYGSKMGYPGVSINMKTNYYTDRRKDVMFSSVTFTRDFKGSILSFFDEISNGNYASNSYEVIEELKNQLKCYLENWKFLKFECHQIEKEHYYTDLLYKIPEIKIFGHYFLLIDQEVI
jgi:hypothetical protein